MKLDDIQNLLAAGICQAYWEMEGGEGVTPLQPNSGDGQVAWVQMNSKVIALCPSCNGTGSYRLYELDGYNVDKPCPHSNAPSIAKLLAIGASVMDAGNDIYIRIDDIHVLWASQLIDYLKAIEP